LVILQPHPLTPCSQRHNCDISEDAILAQTFWKIECRRAPLQPVTKRTSMESQVYTEWKWFYWIPEVWWWTFHVSESGCPQQDSNLELRIWSVARYLLKHFVMIEDLWRGMKLILDWEWIEAYLQSNISLSIDW